MEGLACITGTYLRTVTPSLTIVGVFIAKLSDWWLTKASDNPLPSRLEL